MWTRTSTCGLRGLSLAAALGAVVLASAGSAAAQTYEWSPQKTNSRLTGTLTFVPNDGNGARFQCRVAFDFHTGNAKRGADALAVITSATIKGRGCETVAPLDLPWYVGASNMEFGSLSEFGWNAGVEYCRADTGGAFVSNSDGTWNLDGPCFVGTLSSNPPVTIVPKP